jgi:hypothetical protein
MAKRVCQLFLLCTFIFIQIDAMGRYVPPIYMRRVVNKNDDLLNFETTTQENSKTTTTTNSHFRKKSLAELRSMVRILRNW